MATAEHERLRSGATAWRQWGPYLAERAWGTVREDYSADGDAWRSFPHDHARSRVYRWNEDGLLGISDDQQRLCFALALWNGRDPILKERLFGLTGVEGNHGEDVKEYYYYLDSTPTHSYLRALYRYPQAAFPYAALVEESARRSRDQPEYELLDTGVFANDRYWDVTVEYAKAAPDDIGILITAVNHGPEPADLHLLPTLWFRNTWSWGWETDALPRPVLFVEEAPPAAVVRWVVAEDATLGRYVLTCAGAPTVLVTENETNSARLYGTVNVTAHVKDGINDAVVHGRHDAVNPAGRGTKAAIQYVMRVGSGEASVVRMRLARDTGDPTRSEPADVDALVARRRAEADDFYAALQPASLTDDARRVQRQAFAGLLWTKQFYNFDVDQWLQGDPAQPAPPSTRWQGRNRDWRHLNTADILSVPDAWEYPWFAAWDLAFHAIALALVDPDFAKSQLDLLGREWYQHPNGQAPAYEWNFSDVNPPVLAWAAWRVYKIDARQSGQPDVAFLERAFHKQLLTFTWWVNRKDEEGNNVFGGGFLGLDNIGVFDRSAPLPNGGRLEQSDGTAWMGMFCLNMLSIALELAVHNRVYEDIATKFFEHFLYIAHALNQLSNANIALWDDQDQFFYDVLHLSSGQSLRLKIRSMVGLVPLFAVTTIEPALLAALPAFRTRLEWFLEHRPHLAALISRWHQTGAGERRLLALCRGSRMKRVLRRMLDEHEFLSPYGVRAMSRHHLAEPYRLHLDGAALTARYEPAESASGLFGGNSNWRGPVWFPVNYLLIEALQQFHHYYGDDFLVECPTGSGQLLTLSQIADELSQRLVRLFLRGDDGRRPVFGDAALFRHDPRWRDYVLFYEYFHGDTGAGLGASHQTGWTALVAKLIQQQGRRADEQLPSIPPGGPDRPARVID